MDQLTPHAFPEELILSRGDTRWPGLCERGGAVRLTRGSYVGSEAWLAAARPGRFLLQTAARSLVPGTVFCCETALYLHGYPTFGTPREITVSTESGSSLGKQRPTLQVPGQAPREARFGTPIVRHRHQDALVTVLPTGFATVIPSHALAQVLGRGPLVNAVTVSDAVARWTGYGAPPVAEIQAALEELGREGHAGRVARGVARLAAGRAESESPAESGSRALMMLAGFPPPELQHSLFLEDGTFLARPDFLWPEFRLIAEVDGHVKYLDPVMNGGRGAGSAVFLEKEREDALLASGYAVRRWGFRLITQGERLAALLRGAGLPSGPAQLI